MTKKLCLVNNVIQLSVCLSNEAGGLSLTRTDFKIADISMQLDFLAPSLKNFQEALRMHVVGNKEL